MFSLPRPAARVAAVLFFAAAAAAATPACAQRTHWEGTDNYGTRSTFTRDAAGRWTEQVVGSGFRAVYIFAENEITANYIQLYDVSRNIHVNLFNDRMDIWDVNMGRWNTLYYGRWLGQNTGRFRITFKSLSIIDDKEGGSGDWRVMASLGAYSDVTIVNKMEGDTGAYLLLPYQPLDVVGTSVPMTVRVFEHDGGIGATWEFVGHKEFTVTGTGDFSLSFNNSEGHVVVFFTVEAI